MQGSPYVNLRSCCSSYFNFASSCKIVLPSFCLNSLSSLAKIARWTSSIAPVLYCQHVLTAPKAKLTTMTGHRFRAEIKAKDKRSEVAYGGTMLMVPLSLEIRWRISSPKFQLETSAKTKILQCALRYSWSSPNRASFSPTFKSANSVKSFLTPTHICR